MKGIRVDPKKRTARAQAGVNWGEFDQETQAFGPRDDRRPRDDDRAGRVHARSGSGWLERKHGFAADNLISADLVTPTAKS